MAHNNCIIVLLSTASLFLFTGPAKTTQPNDDKANQESENVQNAEKRLQELGVEVGWRVTIQPIDHVTNDDLALLPTLNPIPRLSIRNEAITAQGLKVLKNIRGLRYVYLDCAKPDFYIGPGVTDQVISYLADNRQLESMGFNGLLIHGETLGLFQAHQDLRTLSISDAFLTEEGLRQIGTLTELETLTLVDCYVNDAGAKHLGNLRNLKSVNLSKNPLTGHTLGSLKEASHLHALRLINCNLSAEGMAALSELKSLHNLFLGDNQIGDRALKRLAAGELKGLSYLSLIRTDVTDEGMEYLASFSGLRGVGLAQTYVTGCGMRHLGGMKNLVSLDLRQTNLTDENVRGLRHLTRIKELGLGGTAITDAAIPVLTTLEQLQELNVSRTGITQEGIRALREALPECEIEGSHFYPPGAMNRFLEAPL